MESKQPGKQRKRHFNAPLHKRQNKIAAPLSHNLRKTHNKRNMPVRKGDEVTVTRGDNKGKKGKVTRVDLLSYRVEVQGLVRRNAKGEELPVPIPASNIKITTLDLTDEKRKKKLNRVAKEVKKHGK